MSIAIVSADLHLLKKPGLWAGRSEISGDDKFGLDQVVKLATDNDADLYLLGDTLDSVTNLPRPIVLAKEALGKVIKHGNRVRYIQGQHEVVVQSTFYNHPWLSTIDGTEHINETSFDFLGHQAYALDYFPNSFAEYNMAKIPKDTEVLFLHGTLEEAMPMGFHFSASMIPAHVKYVFAGDYHVHFQKKLPSGTMYYSVGSTYINSASEQLDKYTYVVTDENGKLKVESVPLITRSIVRLSAFVQNNPVDAPMSIPVHGSLPESMRKPVVLIDIPVDAATTARIANVAHVYMTSGSNPSQADKIEVAQIENLSDKEILERYLDPEKHPDEFQFTLDIIESSTEDALERLRAKLEFEPEERSESTDETIVV